MPGTTAIRHTDRVPVTGANGYVGWQVVQALVEDGYYVRTLVRPTSVPERLKQLGVEVFLGDVRRLEDVSTAADGMQVIIHLAAGMKGSQEFMVDTCVRGTQNVAAAAALQRVQRVIYMSSFSVYDFAKLHDGADITETSPLEEQPESRGAYSLGSGVQRMLPCHTCRQHDPMDDSASCAHRGSGARPLCSGRSKGWQYSGVFRPSAQTPAPRPC